MKPMNIAFVGCGDISAPYAQSLAPYPQIQILGATDLVKERAKSFVHTFGGQVYPTLNDLLEDRQVEVVVDLSSQRSHAEVVERSLEAGKHVHAEKPLAMTYERARGLSELAHQKGLRLSCSPVTVMSESQQTVWKWIREGRLGEVRLAYAEANWSRTENWHPNPVPFYEVGALYDVGVYPLTLLTAIFGPARRLTAYGTVLMEERKTLAGQPFKITTPDFIVALIEMTSGALVRLTTNFYVGWHNKQKGIEFHGDLGSLHLSSWERFDARVEFAQFEQPYVEVPLLRPPFEGIEWGRSLTELAEAIEQKRPHRTSAEHAAHIIEICEAVMISIKGNLPVEIRSTFPAMQPMEWSLEIAQERR